MQTAWDEHRPPDPDLIADCVHCGFCLPSCPSYAVFEDEADSPRACTVLDGPEAVRAAAWAAPEPGALAVMARVKERFDPARIFNPGSFVGGI